MTESIKLLIVDDHPVVRSGLRAMFDQTTVSVVGEAVSGRQAIDLVSKIDSDVVLMDVRMADMDGFDAAKEITAVHGGPRVLILSSFESDDYLKRAVQSGASGYLLKGLDRQDMFASVRAVYRGQTVFDTAKMAGLIRSLDPEQRGQELLGSVSSLSDREVCVLQRVAAGRTNAEIASELEFSLGTIKKIIQEIISKLGVTDRTQAAVLAVKQGMEL